MRTFLAARWQKFNSSKAATQQEQCSSHPAKCHPHRTIFLTAGDLDFGSKDFWNIMEKKMETTIMGYTGYRTWGIYYDGLYRKYRTTIMGY